MSLEAGLRPVPPVFDRPSPHEENSRLGWSVAKSDVLPRWNRLWAGPPEVEAVSGREWGRDELAAQEGGAVQISVSGWKPAHANQYATNASSAQMSRSPVRGP